MCDFNDDKQKTDWGTYFNIRGTNNWRLHVVRVATEFLKSRSLAHHDLGQ